MTAQGHRTSQEMDTVTTFHGRVYGNKLVRKESDLPADFTNASAATRRIFEPSTEVSKSPSKNKRCSSHKTAGHPAVCLQPGRLGNGKTQEPPFHLCQSSGL